MDCDFKVNQIPNGIQVEYNKTNENTDSKELMTHIEYVSNTGVSICMPNNKYVKYNIETCDIATKVHHFETVAEYYYTNDTIGCRFKIKPGMCSPRIDPITQTILFHSKYNVNYYIYTKDGTFIDMIDATNFDKKFDIVTVREFEYYGTYSLISSAVEDVTTIMYDHINKITTEFVCGYRNLFTKISTTGDKDLYIYIDIDNNCELITVEKDDPSNFKSKFVYKFGSEFRRYFITQLSCKIDPSAEVQLNNNKDILVAVDGYNVEIYDFTTLELTLIKSFKLAYMADVYNFYNDKEIKFTAECESFINVSNGKLYYNKSDGILEPLEDSISKKEFMSIDLNNEFVDNQYIPIPLFDCISDEHQELITTFYDNQSIIELTILDNKYILEFPDKKFVMVDMH